MGNKTEHKKKSKDSKMGNKAIPEDNNIYEKKLYIIKDSDREFGFFVKFIIIKTMNIH